VHLALAPGAGIGSGMVSDGHPTCRLPAPGVTLCLDLEEGLAAQAALGWIDGGEWLPRADASLSLDGSAAASSRKLPLSDMPAACTASFRKSALAGGHDADVLQIQ